MISQANSNDLPLTLKGAFVTTDPCLFCDSGGTITGGLPQNNVGPSIMIPTTVPQQVAGLVPVYNCEEECREGLYMGDLVPDDTQYPLPVFALSGETEQTDENDFSYFLFSFPAGIGEGLFFLQKQVNGAWTTVADLDNNVYGIYYDNNFGTSGGYCASTNLWGYAINWGLVLEEQGTGLYRFYVNGAGIGSVTYCAYSPPYCLQDYTCLAADRTVRFDAVYSGGNLGDVNDQTNVFNFCCGGTETILASSSTFQAEATSGETNSASVAHTVCEGGTNYIDYFEALAAFTTVNYNDGSYSAGVYTQLASKSPAQIFSGALQIDWVLGGATLSTGWSISLTLQINTGSGYNNYGTMFLQYNFQNGNPPTLSSLVPFVFPETGTQGIPLLSTGNTVRIAVGITIDFATCPTSTFSVTIGGTGSYWQNDTTPSNNNGISSAIQWQDSIRFWGFFGKQKGEFVRTSLKYQTGIITKVRDEIIKGYTAMIGGAGVQKLPLWLHNRFMAYGLMADNLYVTDYNVNNPDYNIKSRLVVADGNYEPEWKNESRYASVSVAFKDGQQELYRDRCC